MFAYITFEGKGAEYEPQRVDRIALDADGHLLFLSVVADAGVIKGIRGALNTELKFTMSLEGVTTARASRPDLTRDFHAAKRRAVGYHSDVHRIGLNMAHAFFWSKDAGMMLDTSDAHLWKELRDTRFTTPLIRQWVPYIKAQLLLKGMLKEAYCLNCNCGVLDLLTAGFDGIVSEGVRSGALPIPEKAA